MDLLTLKSDIINKKINNFYCFIGEEQIVMDLYIDKIIKLSGKAKAKVDAVSDIFSRLTMTSMVDTSKCYIIVNDSEFLKQEKVWDDLASGYTYGENIIILVYYNLDKRGKFYKQLKDRIVEFEKMSAEVIAKHIGKDSGMITSYALDFANRCNCLYGVVLNELDKLMLYASINKLDINKAYAQAVESDLIYTSPQDVVFKLVESVCLRVKLKSYELLAEYKHIEENALPLISLLYNNFRAVLLVQSCTDKDIGKTTGLTGWQIKNASSKTGKYSIDELIEILRTLQWTEQGIKSGKIENQIAIDYILANTF
jgi:DNA polymerase III delta subunit